MTELGTSKHVRSPRAPRRLARLCRRLVVGPASVQERHLGKGHDMDSSPERHLYF